MGIEDVDVKSGGELRLPEKKREEFPEDFTQGGRDLKN